MKRFLVLVLALFPTAFGQPYVNGPFVTHPGAFAGCPTPGDGSALEDSPPLSMTVLGFSAGTGFRLADQFAVPSDLRWNINSFKVYAYQTNSGTTSTLTSANYRIWYGTPGNGGVILHDFSSSNQLVSTTWTGAYRTHSANIGLCTTAALAHPVMEVVMAGNGLVLGPGTYWLDFALGGDPSLPGPFVPPVTILGLGQTGDALQLVVSSSTWSPITSSTTYPGPYHQGLPFAINYTCTPVLPSPPVLQAVAYVPGHSIGPIGVLANPQLYQDQRDYAAAYWEMVDSCGAVTTASQAFQPQSPHWPTFGISGQTPTDPEPFGDGLSVFRALFAHRLQLNPTLGPLFDIDQLVATDPWVALQWRFWTLTHQVVTASFLDPIAHNNHIQAIIEALTWTIEWRTLGVPYFDPGLTVVASEQTRKLRGLPGVNPPAPLPLPGLPVLIQNYDAQVRALANVLSGFPGLYEADGAWFWGHVGFDCDDFADAIGARIIKGQAGMRATTVRVEWTTPGGQPAAHRVTKVSCGGYYWLIDAQTGAVSGPHANATPVDARPVVQGGYAINNNRPITTIDDGRALGSRPGLREPPAWHTSQAQRTRFQNITGLDPNCFR
jgi:hypothetical protein